MASRIVKWAQRNYSARARSIALMFEGLLFLLLLPYLFYIIAVVIDKTLCFPPLYIGSYNLLIGAIICVAGFMFAAWSVYVQFTIGRGTPAPFMPTQQLITDGPYKYCRNPMTFGTTLLYLGIGIIVMSISYVLVTMIFTLLLLIYVKVFAERFGKEYLEYKSRTSFFIPWIRIREKKTSR